MIVYASRSSITLPALARARLLRLAWRAPVAMVALQVTGEPAGSRAGRWLAPDLLLLPTEAACRAARDLGLRAQCVWSGVDLDRFRPAGAGEKAELRRPTPSSSTSCCRSRPRRGRWRRSTPRR